MRGQLATGQSGLPTHEYSTPQRGRGSHPPVAYYRAFSFFGRSANVLAALPYGVGTFEGEVLGEQESNYRSGLLVPSKSRSPSSLLDARYDSGHTSSMKVAISVPDRVHRAADRVARRLRVPRSRIYVQALEAYLAAMSEQAITRRLDAVHGSEAAPPDPFLAAASRAALRRPK